MVEICGVVGVGFLGRSIEGGDMVIDSGISRSRELSLQNADNSIDEIFVR